MVMRDYRSEGMKGWFLTERSGLGAGQAISPCQHSPQLVSVCCFSQAGTRIQVMATSASTKQPGSVHGFASIAQWGILGAIALRMIFPCWKGNKQRIGDSVFIFWCRRSIISIKPMVIEHCWNKEMLSYCQRCSKGSLGIRWYLFHRKQMCWTAGSVAVDKKIIPSISPWASLYFCYLFGVVLGLAFVPREDNTVCAVPFLHWKMQAMRYFQWNFSNISSYLCHLILINAWFVFFPLPSEVTLHTMYTARGPNTR